MSSSPRSTLHDGSTAAAVLPALFGYGFRPFFLLAGGVAAVYGPWWAGSVAFGWQLTTGWPPMLWHGHEMLFGFIAAALAGFLLTAVPSWTGRRGYAGWPLIALVALWCAGRIAILTSAAWPPLATAVVDLAFLPVLGVFVAIPLLRTRNRNQVPLPVLAALWACNATFHWALTQHDAPLAGHSVRVGIDVMLVLLTVVGGRIVPAFTNSAMAPLGVTTAVPRSWPLVSPTLLLMMVANVLAGIFTVGATTAAAIALGAAVLHAVRLGQWRAPLLLMTPIVWILHLGYAWLAVGLGLKAIALLFGTASAAFWLHALTIGAITSMIVAVMTRASLGHTGRSLTVAPPIAACYLLLSVAAAVRAFGVGVTDVPYPLVLALTGLCWLCAFALYLYVYAPILCLPRADGRPG